MGERPEADRPVPDAPTGEDAVRVRVGGFEGPLDLLLHLVKEHRVDLFDIPIARITEAYLATLQALRELDIDVAGEFLHMAAQLVLMKSRLLLPRTEVAEDAQAEDAGVDPRAELVRRLLEYQKYRAVAEELARHDILDRNVFARRARAPREPAPEGPEGLADVSIYKLIEALDRFIAEASGHGKGQRLALAAAASLAHHPHRAGRHHGPHRRGRRGDDHREPGHLLLPRPDPDPLPPGLPHQPEHPHHHRPPGRGCPVAGRVPDPR